MAMAAQVLGDRWTLLIIRELFYGVGCFEDIRADLEIPSATLQKRLNALSDAGILMRKTYRAPGERNRQGYVLTETGKALAPVVLALRQWGDDTLRDDSPLTDLIDLRTGKPLRLAIIDSDGKEVDLASAHLKKREGQSDD
ncbi:MAG: helix-turn-helix domain-containing protein [Pseudomonadota bacterium]